MRVTPGPKCFFANEEAYQKAVTSQERIVKGDISELLSNQIVHYELTEKEFQEIIKLSKSKAAEKKRIQDEQNRVSQERAKEAERSNAEFWEKLANPQPEIEPKERSLFRAELKK